MGCMACGAPARMGPQEVVLRKWRPLCKAHRCDWNASLEARRGVEQNSGSESLKTSTMYARAFMDWLTRVTAERRNARAA